MKLTKRKLMILAVAAALVALVVVLFLRRPSIESRVDAAIGEIERDSNDWVDNVLRRLHISRGRSPDELIDNVARLGPDAVPRLTEILGQKRPGHVDFAIVVALGKIGDQRAIPALAAASADKRRDSTVRLLACRSLRILGDGRGFELLLDAVLRDGDDGVRRMAAGILREKRDGELVDQLLHGLSDPSASVRAAAGNAVGLIDIHEAEPRLIELLDDSDKHVVLSAVNALGNLRAVGALDALRKCQDRHKADSAMSSEVQCAIGRCSEMQGATAKFRPEAPRND